MLDIGFRCWILVALFFIAECGIPGYPITSEEDGWQYVERKLYTMQLRGKVPRAGPPHAHYGHSQYYYGFLFGRGPVRRS